MQGSPKNSDRSKRAVIDLLCIRNGLTTPINAAKHLYESNFNSLLKVIMSIATIEEPCFLCGTNAKWQESEFGKRRHYLCSNPSCGEYEMSSAAMERVKNNTEFKKRASAMASRNSDPQLILEIVTTSGPDKQVNANLVKRRPSLGGAN